MYAKSIIEYARARVVAGCWTRHISFVPVALALTVGVMPFTLESYFLRPVRSSESIAPRAEPMDRKDTHTGLVLVNRVSAPSRMELPLDAQQRAVARFVTHKYGVSAGVVQELVRTAFAAGKQFGVDPLLVVAMMAVESSFNPIAESVAGAKGLMQIIPQYHLEKFVDFGGAHSVFDPRVNILVGARILREYLLLASGDLIMALQTYAGALADRNAAYTHRVLNEKDRLDDLAGIPKTDRSNRIIMQIDPLRPGTPTVSPTALTPQPSFPATSAAPAVPANVLPPPVAPAPAKPVDEAAHTPPTPPRPDSLPAINLTLVSQNPLGY